MNYAAVLDSIGTILTDFRTPLYAGQLAEALDTIETGIDLDGGHRVVAGDTLLLGLEQMTVSSMSGNTATVVRGANGTTAATHSDNAEVFRLRPFERVFRGNRTSSGPRLAPGGPYACYWYAGEVEHQASFGNVIVYENFPLMVLWALSIEDEPYAAQEFEVAMCNRMLQEDFSGQRKLGGMVKDMRIGLANADWQADAAVVYRGLEFELHLLETEAEGIAA